jgi:hypothetical protein
MILKCGINGETRDDDQIFVCHHCGMPVCEEHGWVVGSDDAFADSTGAQSPAAPLPAFVPPQIRRAAGSVTRDLAGPVRRAVTPTPRPAMHCRDCVERFHKGAPKRHGWSEPRPVTRSAGMAGRR